MDKSRIPKKLAEFISEVGGPEPEIVSSEALEAAGIPWAMNHTPEAFELLNSRRPFLLNLGNPSDPKTSNGTHWIAAMARGLGKGKRLFWADPLGATLGGLPPDDLAEGYDVTANLAPFMRPDANHCGYIAMMFYEALDRSRVPHNDERFTDLLAQTLGARKVFGSGCTRKVSEQTKAERSARMKAYNAQRAAKKTGGAAQKKANSAPSKKIGRGDTPEIEEELEMCAVPPTPASSDSSDAEGGRPGGAYAVFF